MWTSACVLLNLNTLVAQYTTIYCHHDLEGKLQKVFRRATEYFLTVMKTIFQEMFSFFSSDRLVPGLDTIVPFESTKAYDMLDIIQGVCSALIK